MNQLQDNLKYIWPSILFWWLWGKKAHCFLRKPQIKPAVFPSSFMKCCSDAEMHEKPLLSVPYTKCVPMNNTRRQSFTYMKAANRNVGSGIKYWKVFIPCRGDVCINLVCSQPVDMASDNALMYSVSIKPIQHKALLIKWLTNLKILIVSQLLRSF